MRNLRLVHSARSLGCASALPPLAPAVQTMLEHIRVIVPVPPGVRARALARAHATMFATTPTLLARWSRRC